MKKIITETQIHYINLSSKRSVKSEEISEGIVPYYDAEGNLVGIDIDNTTKKMYLSELVLLKIPFDVQKLSA